MRIIITILLIVALKEKSIYGQDSTTCGYPIHVSADSLVNFVIKDYKKRTGRNISYTDEQWRKDFYDNTRDIKYEAAFNKCQDYLIQRLGKYVYCNYIDMTLNSFEIWRYRQNSKLFDGINLHYGLQLPNLKLSQRSGGYLDLKYERIDIKFQFQLQADSSLSIIYPTNVPDCKGLPDCGFIITKDKAIEIAKKNDFLHDNDKYRIITDGINWEITLAEDKGIIKSVTINLQTGQQSKIHTAERID